MSLRVINETKDDINKDLLEECAVKTLKELSSSGDINFSIVLVSVEKIRDLNEKYYSKKGPTDVLTFASDEDSYAGDIIICPSFIKQKTAEDKFEWELCHVAVHGTMHLLGIHHEDTGEHGHKEQHDKEVEIINKVLNN